MAVTSTSRKATFVGNGTATVFPFNFKVFKPDDLYIVVGATVLTLDADYSVVLNGNQDVSPGGSATLTTALATGIRMTITSDVPELQQVVLTNLGGFFPDVLNGEFDRLTILIQQLQVALSLCITFGLTDDLSTVTLPSAADRANKFFYFGADGGISLVSASPIGTAVFSGTLLGTKDGVNTVFQLSNSGSSIARNPVQVTVWKNFPLIPGDPAGYTLGPAPGYVTFATAPMPDDSLFASGVFAT